MGRGRLDGQGDGWTKWGGGGGGRGDCGKVKAGWIEGQLDKGEG